MGPPCGEGLFAQGEQLSGCTPCWDLLRSSAVDKRCLSSLWVKVGSSFLHCFPSPTRHCCDAAQKAAPREASFHLCNCKDHTGFGFVYFEAIPTEKARFAKIWGFPCTNAAHWCSMQLRRTCPSQWPWPKSNLNLDGGMEIVPLSDCE